MIRHANNNLYSGSLNHLKYYSLIINSKKKYMHQGIINLILYL